MAAEPNKSYYPQPSMSTVNSPKSQNLGLLKRLIGYAKPYQRYFAVAILLTILLSVLSPARPMLYQYIINNYLTTQSFFEVRVFILIAVGMLVFETVLSYYNTLLTNWLGQSVVRDLRNQVFNKILRLRMQYFDTNPIGQLQTRTISDLETINDVFRSGIIRISGDILQLVAILAAMCWINWRLTLVILTTVPLMLIATRIFQINVKRSYEAVRKEVGIMNAFLQEHISGMSIVQIFHREQKEAEKFDEINAKMQRANFDSNLYYSIYYPVLEFITSLAMALLVWYGVIRIMSVQDLQFGDVVAFISLVNMFFRPIRMLADQFNTFQLGLVSSERVFQVLDTEERIKDEGKTSLKINHQQPFSIEFSNVWFAYREEEWVLQDFSLKIEKGEKIAFVGATGSGKTTIINLLGRFYEIQRGEILIDGINIRNFPLYELRQKMGVVLQDVFLFSGSVYENITLSNTSIPLSQVEEAARMVGAYDFIQQLPEGFDYQVRERGSSLSTGQRQLIAFARVWVHDPLILIMDEATANIDTESEMLIQHAIDTVMQGRTSIIIAHRLSTIQKADKIVVLEKGKVIESGTHQSLLARQGKYFELYELQMSGSLA